MNALGVQCRGEREYRFEPAHTALLVIDMQREFFVTDADESIEAMRAILPRIKQLIAVARQLDCRVVHTREAYRPDLSDVSAYRRSLAYVGREGPLGRCCIRGEPGNAFVDECMPLPNETVLEKAGFGAFYNSDLDEMLKRDGIDHLVLCGVTTQACVHSTLREAVDRGYWCLTVADCCAATEPGMHDAALDIIAGEGHLFGWVAELGDVEAALDARNRRS